MRSFPVVQRTTAISLFLLCAVHCAFLAPLVLEVHAQAPSPAAAINKNVLVLYDEQDKLPGLAALDRSIRSTLSSSLSAKIDIYTESMDRSRFEEEGYYSFLRDTLKQKYSRKKVDVVISVMGPSLDFLMTYGEDIFPGTPIIFCGVDRRELESRDLRENVTGVLVKREFGRTADIALKLHPNTRRIILIAGTSSFDKRLAEQAMAELRSYEDRIQIEYETNFELNDLLKKVSVLPPDTIILCSTVFRDGTGAAFVPHDVISSVSQNANSPVYGFVDQYLGRGIVGGHLYSLEEHGKKAAELALRVLANESVANLPVVEGDISVDMFDARELRRWGISKNSLPAGSVIRFEELTFWDQYKWEVLGLISFILFQMALILGLLFLRSRRRQAVEESSRFAALAESQHRQLEAVVANVPGIVWESRVVDPAGNRRAQFVSGYVEEMLGYSVEECLADPEFISSKVVDEDREAYKNQANLAFLSGDRRVVQFRCVTKAGGWRWAESNIVAIRDDAGNRVGLRGVTMDITERKKAEEKLKSKEQQLTEAQRLAQLGNWEWKAATNEVTWSEEMYRIYGLDPAGSEISFDDHARFFTPESWADLQAAISHTVETREPYELELELGSSNGRRRWASARGEILGDGEALTLRGTLQDITGRREAEEALRTSETRFRIMADSAPVLIWMSDVEPSITFVSKLCMDFTGLTEKQLLGTGWLAVLHEDDRQFTIDLYTDRYSRREPWVQEYRLRSADGTYHWFYSTAVPRFGSDGEFQGYIGSGVEITDRKEAEEKAKQAHEEVVRLQKQLQEENIYLKEVIKLEHNFEEIIGHSDPLKYVLFKIEQVAPTDATVLITGETGTGKELVARAIHRTSLRKTKPLVTVNCAALSATLIESELFGHERGSFTGAAARKIGRFELADEATLFLDEVGELPLDLQAKLLRVIEDGEFERLGSSKTIRTDVRLIAATNRDLESEVRKGRFREDLLFRLNVFPISVPPLRNRKDDIPELIEYFTSRFAKKIGKSIRSVSPATIRRLCEHRWPGNIRELANVIERSVINAQSDNLDITEMFAAPADEVSAGDTLENIERQHITQVLEQSNWRIEGASGAARILGLNASTLRTRMAKLGISKPAPKAARYVVENQ